jgi:predicted nucleotidyltransferase
MRSMEAKLTELVERLKAASAANLQSVVLYGSAATGEFHAEHSDLNILCIVERAGARELEQLHATAEWWTRQRNPAPLIFTLDELRRTADVFAIELLDMKENHRMLFGRDFLPDFEVSLRLHRLQVERELRANWLRLRHAVLAAPDKRKVHLAIMVSSHSTFCTLFRHALLALGRPKPANKREAVTAIASFTGADPSAFCSILDLREGRLKEKKLDVEATLQTYLEFVEAATNQVCEKMP